jgi:mannose-6-phosphate isomerase-like protein (cupin superfamily)
MRVLIILVVTFALSLSVASAQTAPQGAAPAMKLFASSADVAALIAKAKAERKPDQPNLVQPILRLAPYGVNLEYRAGVAAATLHEKEAELFYVVEGSGTLVTGGSLVMEVRRDAENRAGTAIAGGTSQRLSKGDFVIVPENTPHWFNNIDGALVLMSFHVPRGGKP